MAPARCPKLLGQPGLPPGVEQLLKSGPVIFLKRWVEAGLQWVQSQKVRGKTVQGPDLRFLELCERRFSPLRHLARRQLIARAKDRSRRLVRPLHEFD